MDDVLRNVIYLGMKKRRFIGNNESSFFAVDI